MTKRNFTLEKKILKLVKKGYYPSQMSKLLKVSTTLIIRHLKRLEKEGYVSVYGKCPKFYKLEKKDFKQSGSPSVRKPSPNCLNSDVNPPLISEQISLHDFKVKIPITMMGRKLKNEKRIQINNWVKRYYKDDLPVKATLEITTKSAIIHFHETKIPRSLGIQKAISQFAISGCAAVSTFLAIHGYRLDFHNPAVISQHLATETAEEIDRHIAKGTVFRIMLGREARTITGTMAQEGAAWVDRSAGMAEIETNDLIYEELLLQMPLRLYRIQGDFSNYNENIKKHLALIDSMDKTLKEIRKAIRKRG